MFLPLALVGLALCTFIAAQTEPRLEFGTIFTEKAYLSPAATNAFHLTVGIQVPKLPRALQYRENPCAGATGVAATFCEQVSSLTKEHDWERTKAVQQIINTINQTRALLPSSTMSRKQRTIAGFLRWAMGAASSEAVNNLNYNMKRIHHNMEHSIMIQNANARSMNAFMKTTNSRLDTTIGGVSNNSRAIEEMQNRLQDLLELVTDNKTGFNAIYSLARLTPELIALIRKDLSLLREVQIRVIDFEHGIFDLINGKLSPNLVPVETLMEGLEKIKGIVYENLHGMTVRYDHPIYYYSNSDPVFALLKGEVMVNIEIPLAQGKSIYKLYNVQHMGSPITFVNTTEFHVSLISNLPAAIAISDDGSRWIELSESELASCKGRDILTCPGAIAHRALAPTTCASAIWLKNNAAVEKNCDFLYQNKPFREDHVIKIDRSSYAMFSPDRTANIACPGQPQRNVHLNGLSAIQLACGCSISTTKLIVPPQVSACNHNGLVTKVEYPINAAILSDLAKAGTIPDNLIREGVSLEPWSVAYKPPKYKAADMAILKNQKVTINEIQESLREDHLLTLPDFDIHKKTSEFSVFTTIPSLIVIVLFIGIGALVFYKFRRWAAILGAVSSPAAVKGYTFVEPTPCPAIPTCATVPDVWMAASVSIILTAVILLIVLVLVMVYNRRRRRCTDKTQIFLQISIGAITKCISLTSLPYPTTSVTRSNAEVIGSMHVRKTTFRQMAAINWISTLVVDNCLEDHGTVAYKLPAMVRIDSELATAIYNSTPGAILVRLLVSDGTVATVVPIRKQENQALGWVHLEPPKGAIEIE